MCGGRYRVREMKARFRWRCVLRQTIAITRCEAPGGLSCTARFVGAPVGLPLGDLCTDAPTSLVALFR